MVTLACAVVAYLRSLFLPRHKLALEAVALRQQLVVFKRKQPRPKLLIEKLRLQLPNQPPPRLVAQKESNEIAVQSVR